MATLQALAISGIRGYTPQKLQRIDFTHPLTLITGKNGSGKTTIIECLKYITTGVMPPSAKVQKSFVMDPAIAGSAEVKGDIRLRFRTAKNRVVIAKKIILVSKTQKGLTLKSAEQSLKTKDDDGKQIEVSQRCADIDKQIPEMLGISKPILDNIVFCHQDQSLWPFSDNNTLKGIFDELFDTKRFTKTLQIMKDAIKDFEKQKTELKSQMDYLKAGFYRVIQNRSQSLDGLIEVVEASERVFQVRQQLSPLLEKLKEMSENQTLKNELIKNKGITEFQMEDLKKRMLDIEQKGRSMDFVIETISTKEGNDELDNLSQQIQLKQNELRTLQKVLSQAKDKEATQTRKRQFYLEIKRMGEVLPEINYIKPASADNILQKVREVLKSMKEKERLIKETKQKLSKLTIPSIQQQTQKQDINTLEKRFEEKKNVLQNMQKKIRSLYSDLYKPNVRDEGSLSAQSKKAGEKINKLQAQVELKKSDLKKYRQIKPPNKSVEQQIFQIKYAGVELQNQMLEFIKRKKQCSLCMKKVSDEDLQVIKTKVNKIIKQSQMKIEELQRNHKPSDDIDTTPLIIQIQNFLEDANKTMRVLLEQKERCDRIMASQHQIQLNKQLEKLMKSVELKIGSHSPMREGMASVQKNIQNFRELINSYKYLLSEYRNYQAEICRIRQQKKRSEMIQNEYKQKTSQKAYLQQTLAANQALVKNLNMIQNIYQKIDELNKLIKRQEEKNVNSQQSSSELTNKIGALENLIREMKEEKVKIQMCVQYFNMGEQKDQLLKTHSSLVAELETINKNSNINSDLMNKKNMLTIEQAKLSQKINLKTSQYCRYVDEDTLYLNKLLRFNAISSMISDITTAMKAMQRSTNRLHNEKMDQINKILYDIWQQVYHAKDIQFIRINSISEKKNSGFGYSIMMQKNNQLIEMKGRCSMGQKVLASIIIRMALAEAFSASTHILTLDQPTTNLDRVHIQNLADSISSIIQMEQNSRLQLIIISHDMQFISLLKRHTNSFYEISRNEKNMSCINKKEISQLQEEYPMARLQAIHY